VTVRHRSGSYSVIFCSLAEAIGRWPEDSVVVTDGNVLRHYADQLGAKRTILHVEPGEGSKSVATWSELQSSLVGAKATRSTSIVAFGGGVVGDLAGFVAATYMRGVPLIQAPTSLLAQVDSSVGGKVGIDLPEGKNLVGAFYPPTEVQICLETLRTLPDRELRNGMAEVWKYGFILDAPLCARLAEPDRDFEEIVRRCIDLKRAIVEADEHESTGERAKLNFGHTVGHALEKLAGYGALLHGEAISIGMVAEAALGEAIGLSEKGTREAVEECLRSEGLPTTSVVLRNVKMLIDAMRGDKKATGGRLAFSLLTQIGECRLVPEVTEADVAKVLSEVAP
jgi:3-dehydroquinate synthase